MKTAWLKMAAVAVATCGMSGIVRATPITPISGDIAFTGDVELDSSVGTATEVLNWTGPGGTGLPVVSSDSGSFSGIAPGTPVTFATPWQFNGGPVPSFWTVGGFTFSLVYSYTVGDPIFGVVAGHGVVGNGLYAEPMSWVFSPSGAGTSAADGLIFSFQASAETPNTYVPDGGTTAMLLGLGILGLGWLKKQMFA